MEAIMIGGLAVLAVGGYCSAVDFVNDLGLNRRKVDNATNTLSVSRRYVVAPQTGIKKMAGVHI